MGVLCEKFNGLQRSVEPEAVFSELKNWDAARVLRDVGKRLVQSGSYLSQGEEFISSLMDWPYMDVILKIKRDPGVLIPKIRPMA